MRRCPGELIYPLDTHHVTDYISGLRRSGIKHCPRDSIVKIQKVTIENRAKVYALLQRAFPRAYHGSDICGLHLAPMAVAPEFQKQGVGAELLRFALRQEAIKSQTLFVLGEP